MHNSITLGLTTIACFTVVACNSEQKTVSIPATPLVEPTPIAALTPAVETPATEQTTPPPLAIGDDAPAITVDHWVKGGAIDGFEDGQVYVMEFWATWCGPCVSSMPHLSGLQDEYGDSVKIIGVSKEQDLETITGFLAETNKRDNTLNNDRMRYTVAHDPDGSTSTSFMEAAGQNGIPAAFIVDGNGKIAWIGHPMGMDEPLAAVVEGTWDIAAASEEFRKEQARDLEMMAFSLTLRRTSDNEDWDGYITAIDEYTAEYGGNPRLQEMKFNALLTGKEDKAAAYALASEIVESEWDNSNVLNAFAWGIIDETPAEYQDLNFALRVANRACELTDYKNSMILDTLARCYWEMGDRYKAIAWQEKAVVYAEEGQMGESIQATLNEYQATLANVDE